MKKIVFSFLTLFSSLFACQATTTLQTPYLSITQPSGTTLNTPVEIHIDHLEPLKIIKVKATAIDQKGETWVSHAIFQADEQGSINTETRQPLPGSSYEAIDQMGLFWSMIPSSGDSSSSFKCQNDEFTVEVTIHQEDELIDKQTLTLFLKKPDVQRIEIREKGMVGVLFIPPAERPLPVIITLSGSNGGISDTRAKLLASNGFAVFALGYFGVDGLPSKLQNIPLEYFKTAFDWLQNQPNIDASHVGLYGVSRGAELALILGSVFPDSVQAIAAVVPSSVIYAGLGETPVNAWVYQEKPILPFAPVPHDFTDDKGRTAQNPANMRQNFLEGMKKNPTAFAAAAIPVEKICCPILLVSGGNDQMWPSDLYAEQILDRLKKNHSSIVCKHLHYPASGHGINIPNLPIPEPTYYHPVAKLWFSMGGTRAADAAASLDSWNQLVAFFQDAFNSADATTPPTKGIDGIQFVTQEQLQKELINRGILHAEPQTEKLSNDWMIGGKIHFEEQGSADYVGTVEINKITRKTLKDYFDVQFDACDHNAKALIKKENNQIILTHYEERSKPGIGEELHATLLYTSKRVEDAHHTLYDIYDNLREVDAKLPAVPAEASD